jgi:hypothetical protein
MTKKRGKKVKKRKGSRDPFEAAGNRLIRDRNRVADKTAREINKWVFG